MATHPLVAAPTAKQRAPLERHLTEQAEVAYQRHSATEGGPAMVGVGIALGATLL